MAGEQILIVEDNAINMKLLRDVLRVTGYRTLEASTAAQALRLATEHGPALVLMDIQLPDMDGLEALGRLRKDERTASIPVLAVTAQAMSGDRERLGKAGFDGCLAKPVDIDELLATVEKLCPSPATHEPDRARARAPAAELRSGVPDSLDAVEDKVEPELELIGASHRAGHEMPRRVGGKVRVLVDVDRSKERRQLLAVQPGSAAGIAGLPEGEAEDVAVDRVIGKVQQLIRKSGLAEPAQEGVDVAESGGRDARRGHERVAGPWMLPEDPMGRDGRGPDGRLPREVHRREVDLLNHPLHDRVDDLVAAGGVVVQRHRLDTEIPGQPSDRDRR